MTTSLPTSETNSKKELKSLSANVQKLRFMKIAEHDREQTKLKLQQEQDNNLQWCLVGWENAVRNASKTQLDSTPTSHSTILVQARRSYGGINKPIEEEMKRIQHRIEKYKKNM